MTAQPISELLAEHPLIDLHNDWALVLRKQRGTSVAGLDEPRPELQTDIPRLREGHLGAQFWASSVVAARPEAESTVDALQQLDLILRFVEAHPEHLELAYTADDIERVHRDGRIASLLAVEGGHQIASSLAVLRTFARLGVRYLTLTHFTNTPWADSSTDVAAAEGLTREGLAIIAELNRLGVLVDISHVSDLTAEAAIRASTSPVIFSHSSARSVASHVRNAPDALLELLPDNGGVIHATFVPGFVSDAVGSWYRDAAEVRREHGLPARRGLWPAGPLPGQDLVDAARQHREREAELIEEHRAGEQAYDTWVSEHPRPSATVDDVVAHIEHLRDIVGIDHVGIGSDYDGSPDQPEGLQSVADFPRLLERLRERGWSREELVALSGGNTLRVLRDNEENAATPLWPGASS